MAFFRNADWHGFIFVGVETANHGRSGSQRDFVLAASSTEQHAYAQDFLLWSHEEYFFQKKPLRQKRVSAACFQDEMCLSGWTGFSSLMACRLPFSTWVSVVCRRRRS